ncbi:transcriptional regulator, TetR family [Pseudoxanthomonas sp. GM95]|uniref:TetR/AcrR family transcriptional regulator n=1 Tax=Pseudoxanthomonas sp. GM95 TaxID=1881043 RepID=UPI0008C19CAB|nr:TetR/AcrR family transcriptional regulator [Pseudoxanthomonas sp. GM95]SEM59412.1 transcriptional regulator, TetR family [Pseudoxanthomonas sp. GM95]
MRQQKRKETRARISKAALGLFIAKGFEATTLDELAVAAGISRRTFFHYFKSKEEVLVGCATTDFKDEILQGVVELGQSCAPLGAIEQVMTRLAVKYESPKLLHVDRLLGATDGLRERQDAGYVDLELALAQTFKQVWGKRLPDDEARLIALIAVGNLRIAKERWRLPENTSSLERCMRVTFALTREKAPALAKTPG